MGSLRRTISPIIRNAIAPISTRAVYALNDDDIQEEGLGTVDGDVDPTISNNNNHIQDQDSLPNSLRSDPIPMRDIATIQSRVASVFEALQTDYMSPAELSLIRTVRDTASDTSVLSKIVSNSSFQEFVNNYVPSVLFEQQPMLAGGPSSSTFRPTTSFQQFESNIEEDYSSDSEVPSSPLPVPSHSNDARRRLFAEDSLNRSTEEITLNRVNQLCNQISPDLGLFSGPSEGWRKERAVEESEESTYTDTTDAVKPTMEAAGVPGMPQPAEVSAPPPPWANPVYLFVVTACVIPLTVLAVTTVVHPSNRTWSLLRQGFKAVCAKVFG